jgi:hypothetical protein
VKVKLAVILDCEGIIHHEFQLNGHMVNKKYYLKVMEMLREAVRRIRTGLWRGKKNGYSIKTMLQCISPF